MINTKRNVKILILSVLADVKDEVSESVFHASSMAKNINFIVSDELNYGDFLTCIEEVSQKNSKKEMQAVREKCIQKFMNQICQVMPDYIFFGPFIPGKFDESVLIKHVINQFPFCREDYSKKHSFEIWRHDHEVKFFPLFEIDNEKTKKEFQNLGVAEISGINCSLTNNKNKIVELLLEIDKLEERKLIKV